MQWNRHPLVPTFFLSYFGQIPLCREHADHYITQSNSKWYFMQSNRRRGKKSPDDMGNWYCLFKNLEASLSFLWHKTRTKVCALCKRIWLWSCESKPDDICSLAAISIWIIVSVYRNRGCVTLPVSVIHLRGYTILITIDQTWKEYKFSICSANFASCSTSDRGRPSPSATKNS